MSSDHFKAAMGQMGHAYSGMPDRLYVISPRHGGVLVLADE